MTDPGSAPERVPAGALRPSLARSTAVMAVGTTLSRITGFGRTVALAYALGQNRVTDAYNVANNTPNIVYELILGGVLSATLVPVFVGRMRAADEGDEGAWRDVSAVATAAVAVAIAATVAFALAAPWIIRLYLSSATTPDQRALATTLLRLFAPQVACYALVSLTTAMLQARRRFAAPMFAPIANNVVVIGVLLALPALADDLTSVKGFRADGTAVMVLGLGTTAGVVAMTLAQVVRLPAAGVRLRPVLDLRNRAVREVLRLSGWTLGVVLTNQVALWVAYRLATGNPGHQSAYTVAYQFFLLPHGIVAVSVISALGPELAEDWASGRPAALAGRLVRGLRALLAVVAPLAVATAVLARPIVAVAVERGRFTAGDTGTTAQMLVGFAVGLPAFSTFLLLARAWQSMKDTRTLFLLYAFENGANILLALVLYDERRPWGLSLAYALAYAAGTAVTVAVLGRRLGRRWTAGLGGWAARLAAVLVVAGGAGALAAAGAGAVDGRAGDLAQVAAGGVVVLGSYMVLAPLVGVREPLEVLGLLRRRIRR